MRWKGESHEESRHTRKCEYSTFMFGLFAVLSMNLQQRNKKNMH